MRFRFVVDVNVGRLAKWLRVMGYDALYIPDVDDAELLRVAIAQDRIVLTRDRYILERKVVTSGQAKVILIPSDNFREQLRFVAKKLALSWDSGFTFCIECNEPLTSKSRESVAGRVPPYVFNTQEHFQECLGCGRLYWRGTHWRNMRAELAELTKG